MATPNSLALILASAFLLPSPAHAATTPPTAAAPDPCLRRSELKTRDQILAAIPPNDDMWTAALNKRGIRKEENGWMQYIYGGSATASDRAFTVTFEEYCIARMSNPNPKPTRPMPQTTPQIARPAEREKIATEAATVRTAKSGAAAKGIKDRLADMFKFAEDEIASPPEAPAPPTAGECESFRAQAENCQAAGMLTASESGYGLGTEAKCHRAIANYTSCRKN